MVKLLYSKTYEKKEDVILTTDLYDMRRQHGYVSHTNQKKLCFKQNERKYGSDDPEAEELESDLKKKDEILNKILGLVTNDTSNIVFNPNKHCSELHIRRYRTENGLIGLKPFQILRNLKSFKPQIL